MYFQLWTGCRPNEAAYLVATRGCFPKNAYANPGKGLPKFEGTWMAVMPASETKTRRDYKWQMPNATNFAVCLQMALHVKYPDLREMLGGVTNFAKALEDWFVKRVLKDVGHVARPAEGDEPGVPRFCMRSTRCYRGTEWVRLAREADVLKQTRPPNPLQHTDARTTMRHYALPDAQDGLEAGRRIADRRVAKQVSKAEARLPQQINPRPAPRVRNNDRDS